MWSGDGSTRDQQLLVGHLMMISGLTEASVKARELEVQPQAESQMNRIACPQRRRLGQTEMGCGIEILGCQGQRLQAILSQQAKPPPGFLSFFKRDRPAARLEKPHGRGRAKGASIASPLPKVAQQGRCITTLVQGLGGRSRQEGFKIKVRLWSLSGPCKPGNGYTTASDLHLFARFHGIQQG